MIIIDGSVGEGGGQIVRTSLALSPCLGKPFRIKNIRIKRPKPGLAWQHLAAVNAAAQVGDAKIHGAQHGSTEFSFFPQALQAGNFTFDIGSAGSTSLVLQTILPALLFAKDQSIITLIGGTHNPLAPSFDFIDQAYFPLLKMMGAHVTAKLERPGYMPNGGGIIRIEIKPCQHLSPLLLDERGELKKLTIIARVAGLPRHIAEREIKTLSELLRTYNPNNVIEKQAAEHGPGNALIVKIQSRNVTEIFTGYGQPHKPAEKVADELAREVLEYLRSGVPVGKHLADQLLLPMALCGQGCITTMKPTSHTLTNMHVIRQFIDVNFETKVLNDNSNRITLHTQQT